MTGSEKQAITVKRIGPDIWWAYFTTTTRAGVEFEGDVFQGPNAEALARAWGKVWFVVSTHFGSTSRYECDPTPEAAARVAATILDADHSHPTHVEDGDGNVVMSGDALYDAYGLIEGGGG